MVSTQKKDSVHRELLDRLVTGRYGFGEKIFVKQISEETGASRQPVMTAINKLKSEGFVRIVPQVGCEVISPTVREIGDFFAMFGRIEGLLAELAAERGSKAEVAELRQINERIARLNPAKSESGEAYRRLNRDLHNVIHGMARSPMLHEKQVNHFAMSDFLITHSFGFTRHLEDAVTEHKAIIRAIEQGNPQKARLLAEEHIAVIGKLVKENTKGSSEA